MTTGPAASRAPRSDARRNSERIVSTARAAFAEHGADASLIDIARRAGVGSATLYRHFPTREALLEAVYREQIDALATQARNLVESMSPMDALDAWLRAFAAHMTRYRGMKGLMAAVCRESNSELASWCRDQLGSAAALLLGRAQRSAAVRPDVAAWQMLRLVNGVVLANEQAGVGGDQTQQMLTLVIDGLRYRNT
jgi:AcrR family transcriptional regulator